MVSAEKLLAAALVAGVLFVACFDGCVAYGTAETLTINVTKTERVTTGSGESQTSRYLVFTESETFENTDSIWYGKWDSSDIHGRLQPQQTYKVKVCGWRLPFFSSYRNIVELIDD